MKTKHELLSMFGCALLLFAAAPQDSPAASAQILGWNNLGMHCMDSDYSVFSVLPPYNTIEAQLIVSGKLVTNGNGYTVTYQAVADPDGSFNSTVLGKGNYDAFVTALYGAVLPPEMGLAGWAMPGIGNTPQSMLFEQTNRPAPGVATKVNWFRAEGIPITPYDDAGRKNPYPMMRLIARNGGGTAIATNDIVLPVSDEMDCRTCHASGTQAAAQPEAGWVWSSEPERDFRLNILRLHDESNFAQHNDLYVSALAARGFNPQGLYRGVVADNQPVLCATCHASEALGTLSYSNVPPLTASIHTKHATVLDPELNLTLDHSDNRSACYRCHPGSATKCLRGAMGGAIAKDGTMSMQCQSCHGNMSAVGSLARVGWFMEPNCQSCHSGTATSNNGQIRYDSCFETNGAVRVATNQTFATSPNLPANGISLYRFSTGHGGLQCSACHGSTHAEFPATHRNDNVRNERIQGHAGVMVECTTCHTTSPKTTSGGPHGMHPVGQTWISGHKDAAEDFGASQCQACHGTDYRGTVLSRMQSNRALDAFGTKNWWRGFQVGCYNCHQGPDDDDQNSNTPAVVGNANTNIISGAPVVMALTGTDANGNALTFRIVSQPEHGAVGLSNRIATYFPEPGFVGTDRFTFAAWDGSTDSNLGTGTVAVAQGPFSITAQAHVPPTYPMAWPAPFSVVPVVDNLVTGPTFDWDFGDGSVHSTNQFPVHTYAGLGDYTWQVVSTVKHGPTTAFCTNSGSIQITGEMAVSGAAAQSGLIISWPAGPASAVLEESDFLGTLADWQPVPNAPGSGGESFTVNVNGTVGNKFFRVRQVK